MRIRKIYCLFLMMAMFLIVFTGIILAEEIRPALLDIKKAERAINKAEREIEKAKDELRIFNSQLANKLLQRSSDFLKEAKEYYDKKNDERVKELSEKAIDRSLKTIMATIDSLPAQVRGLWLDSRTIADAEGREGLQKLLDQVKGAGFNIILPEVFFKGQTIIPEDKLFVQDHRFSGWEEDPLRVLIEEASLRGMKVHAWVWVFNENTHGRMGIILEEHPEWANRDREGNIVTYHNSTWLSAGREEVRNFLLTRYSYLVENYDLDGINLDYIRFPEEYRASYGYDEYTVSLFKEKYGIDPFNIKTGSPEAGKWNKFREGLITEMVVHISEVLRKKDPDLIISADVIPGREEARYRVLQNWELWLKEGYLDFVLPMTYTNDLFAELYSWVKEDNQNIGKPLFPGISVFKITPDQVVEQVVEINEVNPAGMALFAAAHLEQEHYELLSEGPFRKEAALPYTDKEEALKLIEERIRKRIEMAVARKMITESEKEKLIAHLYEEEIIKNLLQKFEQEGKKEIAAILSLDYKYLQEVDNLF